LFFQKHPGRAAITGVRELDPALWPDHAPLLQIDSHAGLLNAAQMNVIEFHTWNARSRLLGKPDRMVFDLDPGEGVSWQAIKEGAQLTRALLRELGLKAWLKTSGGKGLHLVVPLAARRDYPTVKAFSKSLVEHLARTLPQRFVARSGPANRGGRIFVDYLRNGEGATTVAAFSVRARPGLGVSMPIDWDELDELKSADQWTIADARDHLSLRQGDPWAALAGTRQSLTAAMRTLAVPSRA
jgi:bifunctional non-homologous end joining protein LigD